MMNHSLRSLRHGLCKLPPRLSLTFTSALAAGLTLLGQPVSSAAVTCSYGENFDWADTTSGGASKTGIMTMLDIDREAASVVVTRTAGGNLPSAIVGGYSHPTNAGYEYTQFSPALASSTTPAYGRPLYLTGTNAAASVPASDDETSLTFTFSKTMRNLVMHFKNGDNKIFTFTDENDAPLEFTFYHVGAYQSGFGSIPTTGTGAGSEFFVQPTSNSLAIGENASGTIAFKKPVKVIKMARTYIRNTLTAANLNTGSSVHSINFGQYCDQPGVLDYCNNISFAQWETATANPTLHTNPDTFAGRLLDETGKIVDVTFSGGLSQSATVTWPGFTNAGNPPSGVEEGSTPVPYRPATPLIVTTDTATGTAPVTLTWTFSEEVKNPALLLRGASSAMGYPLYLKFYKADGVTPLPFLLRSPSAPDRNRQVDSNTLYAAEAYGSTIQFTDSTTAIVMKANRITGTGTYTFSTQSTVFIGCNGTLTGSGSMINADSDGDGVSDLTDKCPNTPVGAVVGSDGCPLPTDLSVVKTASVTKITPGVPFTYTITVTNTGAQATNVKASDVVPAGLTINSISASDSGVTSQTGQSVQAVWSIVPDGGVRTLTINVTKP